MHADWVIRPIKFEHWGVKFYVHTQDLGLTSHPRQQIKFEHWSVQFYVYFWFEWGPKGKSTFDLNGAQKGSLLLIWMGPKREVTGFFILLIRRRFSLWKLILVNLILRDTHFDNQQLSSNMHDMFLSLELF